MDNSTGAGPRWAIAPFFCVGDVVGTANYYRDVLGFRYERFWGEPPSFCMVKRAGIIVMLSQGPGRPNHRAGTAARGTHTSGSNADGLYEEYTGSVHLVRPPCDQFYGCRDFEVENCNGYRLCFGQSIT